MFRILSDDEKQEIAEWARAMPPSVRPWLLAKRKTEEASLGAALFRGEPFDPIAVARRAGDYSDAIEALNQLLGIAKRDARRIQEATKET